MGGGISKAENTQNQIAQQQLALSQTEQQQAAADTAKRDALLQPSIDFNKAIASGDKSSLMTAAAPLISNITGATSRPRSRFSNPPPQGPPAM